MGEAITPLKTERPERSETARVENRMIKFGKEFVEVTLIVKLSMEVRSRKSSFWVVLIP